MQGWGWRSVHHPDHLDRVVAHIRRSFESGEPWEDTFPLRASDGTYRWFLSRALPIRDADGAVVRWLGTNTDITDQRRLEAELAEANQRKDVFLATLAHELRNPLGAMRTSVAVMQASRHDAVTTGRALAVVERQCAHVARLLDDLLDVSRISRDRLELQLADVDLRQVVLDTVDVMLPVLAAAGVHFEARTPDGPLETRVDPARVQQMIGNLLANAAKYTPAGGRAHLTLDGDDDTVTISIGDTGVGLAPDMLGPIFDLFVQVPDRHRSQQGLGIGLSLVRRLAELHGGRATAASPGLGHGSTFEVRLPRRPSAPRTVAVAPAASVDTAARRVLLVDDDLDNAEAFSTYLRVKGHVTTIARSGEEALVLAGEAAPDVVLLDIGLPGIDGYETCRRLRARGSRALVAALTGWGQDEDRRRTASAGFDQHLVKPVSPETVLALVAAAPRFDRR
jgi:signal transduction histidine kinase